MRLERSSIAQRGYELSDDTPLFLVLRLFTFHHVIPQHRVLAFQQRAERCALARGCGRVITFEISLQQHVEFLHAAAAEPFETRLFGHAIIPLLPEDRSESWIRRADKVPVPGDFLSRQGGKQKPARSVSGIREQPAFAFQRRIGGKGAVRSCVS